MKSKFITLTTLTSFALSPLAIGEELDKASAIIEEEESKTVSLEDFYRHLEEMTQKEEALAPLFEEEIAEATPDFDETTPPVTPIDPDFDETTPPVDPLDPTPPPSEATTPEIYSTSAPSEVDTTTPVDPITTEIDGDIDASQVPDSLLEAPDTYELDEEFVVEPEAEEEPYDVQAAPKKGLSITQSRTAQNILLALIATAVAITTIVLVSKNKGSDADCPAPRP